MEHLCHIPAPITVSPFNLGLYQQQAPTERQSKVVNCSFLSGFIFLLHKRLYYFKYQYLHFKSLVNLPNRESGEERRQGEMRCKHGDYNVLGKLE